MWILANHQDQQVKDGMPLSTVAERTSNNIVRLTNVLFSHKFLDSFLALNDIKNRVDHETRGMPGDFWADVAEALNGSSEDNNSALEIVLSEEDLHYEEIMTSSSVRKKFNMLLKVRKVMKKHDTKRRT